MDGIHKSIFLWGLISLIGYGAYHFFLFEPSFPQPLPLWSVLTVIGIAGMLLWVPAWQKNKVVHTWLVVGVLGMLYHWAFALEMVPAIIQSPWAYWALITALGLFATGYFWTNKNMWYGLGVLHVGLFLVYYFAGMLVMPYASALFAIASGVPLMYIGWKGK